MLDNNVRKKLSNIKELPTIPSIINDIIEAIDDPDTSISRLSRLVEKDQTITARVLRIANSPFYGFSRRISTIDLAVVVMGMNTLKEIILALVVQKLFAKVNPKLLNIKEFWNYSLFCGSTSRFFAKKLGYKVAGEAFVAGLMHDLGILIEAEYFSDEFAKVRQFNTENNSSFLDSERMVFNSDHCEIGAIIAERWNLPTHLVSSIRNHHTHFSNFREEGSGAVNFENIDQQLTAIVSLSEFMAELLGYKSWAEEQKIPEFYLSYEIIDNLDENEILQNNSAIEYLKLEIKEEFEKASVFNIIN